MRPLCAGLTLCLLAGCSPASTSPDAIREHAADATAAAKRDTTAVAQGVFEGLRRKGPLNINKASREQLMTLPGLTARNADVIIAGRPYSNSTELLHKHILSRAEYGKIADHIVAK